jgi:hypothetical protein
MGYMTFHERLWSLMPKGWFPIPADAPNLRAFLAGPEAAIGGVVDALTDAKTQSRIRTATGFWLDLVALDFFGRRVQRAQGQSDAGFRAVILANLIQERVTKRGMASVIENITGISPTIFELWDAQFSGGLDAGFYCDFSIAGDVALNHQCLISANRPQTGLPGFGGLIADGDFSGSVALGSIEGDATVYLVDQVPAVDSLIFGVDTANATEPQSEQTVAVDSFVNGLDIADGNTAPTTLQAVEGFAFGLIPDEPSVDVSDDAIYDAINMTRPTGTVAWVLLT